MSTLNRSTRRRLQNLHQVSSVWEGDRRSLPVRENLEVFSSMPDQGECVIWVDGVQGVVRAMDVVTAEAGPEAMVRTLLQAMEHPSGPAQPARPQKIVVRDRELQFFLRGVLQQMDIAIDYSPALPLIDEIFRGLQDATCTQQPQLPSQYAEQLEEKAEQIWQDAPWDLLAEQHVLALELNRWDLQTLYVSVLVEYGILFYRSLDSLKLFQQRMLIDCSEEQLEEAFLGQDCLFVTFENADGSWEEDVDTDLTSLSMSVQPSFGNLHPLEGIRSYLYEEEATAILVALEALHRFFQQHKALLSGKFPTLSSNYQIEVPQTKQSVPVKVKTMPELADELLAMAVLAGVEPAEELDFLLEEPLLRDDLVPKNSFLSLGFMAWETVSYLRTGAQHYQPGNVTPAGEGLPIVLIQTSRPKAKTLITDIKQAGGLEAICFNPGEDPEDGERYDLGILQTKDAELHLFGEFNEVDPVHLEARKKWDQRCNQTQGWCGLIIAKGVTGASRGKPKFEDMLALFEVRSLSAEDLDLGTLQLTPQIE